MPLRTLSPLRSLLLAAAPFMAVCATNATAEPITFTETATVSGFGELGAPVTNVLLTIVVTADTNNINSSGDGSYYLLATTSCAQLGAGPCEPFQNEVSIFDSQLFISDQGNPTIPAAGFIDTLDVLDTVSALFATYDLNTDISVTGPALFNAGWNYPVGDYSLIINSVQGDATFTAVLGGEPGSTPEPSTFSLLGTAAVLFAFRARRILRVC